MPATVIDTEQEQSQSTDPAGKKTGKRGRTRIPPKTLPADFDFGASSDNAPPKTLPADFDFDAGQPAAQLRPDIAAQVAIAKTNIAKYPENQPKPDPALLEMSRGMGDANLQGIDPEQKRRIKAAEVAEDSKHPAPDIYVAPAPVMPQGHGLSRGGAQRAFDPNRPKTEGVITGALEGFQENINEPLDKLAEAVGHRAKDTGLTAAESIIGYRRHGLHPLPMDYESRQKRHEDFKSDYPKTAGIVGGASETIGRAVGDPRYWPLMFASGPLGKALQAGFTAQMAKGTVEGAVNLKDVWDRPDIPKEEKYEMMSSTVISGLMTAVSAGHMVHGAKVPAPLDKTLVDQINLLPPAAREAVFERVKQKLTLKERLQSGIQHAAGTGPRLAEKVTKKAVAEVQSKNASEEAKSAKAQERYAGALADHETKLARINEDFDDKIAKTRQQYADDVATREKKVSELQAQHADKVAEARREWVQKAYEAKESTRAQAKVEGRREALKSAQKRYAELIRENVKAAHSSVRASLDARWNQLREVVGTEHPVSPTGIYEAVEKSRAMLAGVPADLKIFNDIFKEITEPDTFIESPEGPKPAPKEYITFDNARTHYSALGEKAYAADGNLRRALFNVYEAYDQALSKTATDAGAGKQYASVKKDWSQYMRDWHDMSSAATGGSPLARVYRAVDNPVVTAHVMSKFGDRLFATFARYDKYGANPSLLSKLRNNVQETAALPKVKTVKEPGKFESPGEPKLPEPVEDPSGKISEIESQRTKTLERAEPPVPVKPPALTPNPTVADMVETLRRAKQEKAKDFAAGQKWHPYDLIMGSWVAFGLPDAMMSEGLSRATVHAAMYFGVRVGWMKFVKSPMGMEWMTKVTKADIDTIRKTLAQAPEEKVELGKAVTEAMEDTARAGGPPPNIAKFKTILTPEQQREIMKTVKDINELKARGIKPPDVTAQASTEGRTVGMSNVPESSAAAGGSGTAAGAAADNADIAQARKNLGLSPGQWDSRLLSEAQKIKDQRLSTGQGGHAGGGVSSVEELSRPGVNYIVSRSGQLTYHGKSFAPESIPLGSTHVTVLGDGSIRINNGSVLNPAQEAAIRKALGEK